MPRASSLRSGFIAAIVLINLSLSAQVQAQTAAAANRVTACVAGQPGTLTLITSSHIPLPAPSIAYLPGPDDCTVLVADFPGLTWVGDPRIIRPEGAEPGILEVRVGQFQDSPPVCRVSVTSKDPSRFKGVTFQNLTGQLLVKWKNDGSVAADPLPTSVASRRLVPYYSEEAPEPANRPPRRLLPAYTPGDNTPERIVAAPASTARALPPSAPNFNGSPSYLPPVSYRPPPPLSSSSAHDPGEAAWPSGHKQASTGKAAAAKPTAAPQQDADADDLSAAHPVKQSGLLHKLASKTGRLFNANDQESHDKLTTPEPAKVAASQQTATMKKQAGDKMPPSAANSSAAATTMAPKPDLHGQPLAIQMVTDETSVVENLKIDVLALRKLSYKAFRMHNPERYVVDFEQLPELTKLALPDSDSPLFYRFRAGTLPDKPNIDRLVLDLPDPQVQITDHFDENMNTLSLLLYRKDATISGAAENGEPPASTATAPGDTAVTTGAQSSATSASAAPLAPKIPGAKTIVLDAGHGGSDPGAQRCEINEKDLTLGITLKLKQILEQQGATVMMTRSDDTFVSLEDRVKLTNQVAPDLFLSVHINAMESANDIEGIETYYQTDQSKTLADSIHQGLIAGVGAPDRSIRKARFYVINHTAVPAVLAEVGFISNKEERQKLSTADYQQKIAQALASGIGNYLASRLDNHGSRVAQNTSSKPVGQPIQPLALEGTMNTGTKSLTESFSAKGVTRQAAF